jgi:hypothetical protein
MLYFYTMSYVRLKMTGESCDKVRSQIQLCGVPPSGRQANGQCYPALKSHGLGRFILFRQLLFRLLTSRMTEASTVFSSTFACHVLVSFDRWHHFRRSVEAGISLPSKAGLSNYLRRFVSPSGIFPGDACVGLRTCVVRELMLRTLLSRKTASWDLTSP